MKKKKQDQNQGTQDTGQSGRSVQVPHHTPKIADEGGYGALLDLDGGWGGYTKEELAEMVNNVYMDPEYIPEVPLRILFPGGIANLELEELEMEDVDVDDEEIWGIPFLDTPDTPDIPTKPTQATLAENEAFKSKGSSKLSKWSNGAKQRGTGWTSKRQKETKGCIHAEGINIEIIMNPEMYQSLIHLCSEINTEWLGYFRGTQELDGDTITYRPTSVVFPEQEVSGSMCSPTEEIHDTLGIIHSHHTMGAFFSGQDDANVNMNNNFSIVVSKGEMKAVSKVKLPCGAVIIKDADILVEVDDDIVQKVKAKLTEKTYNYAHHTNSTKGEKGDKYGGFGGYGKYSHKRDLYSGYGY